MWVLAGWTCDWIGSDQYNLALSLKNELSKPLTT